MISSNEIKFVKSLHQKKFREQEGLFIVEGEKLLSELLKSDWSVESIYATAEWFSKNNCPPKIKTVEIKRAELERISALASPNEVLAVVRQREFAFNEKLSQEGVTLILEDVKDPGNLGTIIRIADWFGIKQVICSEQSVELFNPKTVQSTMGSLFHLPIVYGDVVTLTQKIQQVQIPVYGAVMDGSSVYSESFPKAMALIMGSESHGISPHLDRFLEKRITIPSFGAAESLNVGVATGIICSHYRQLHS